MNDSNNNIFDNAKNLKNNSTSSEQPRMNDTVNNTTVQQQNNTLVNPTSESDSIFGANNASVSSTSETLQPSRDLKNSVSFQPQSDNHVNTTPVINSTSNQQDSISDSNEFNQSQTQTNKNLNNDIPSQQSFDDKQAIDEELLKAFIGDNYDKITTQDFNFAGFFFWEFYMFYRKMFLYGLIAFIVNLILVNVTKYFIVNVTVNFIVYCLLFGFAFGFFVNKIYLYYAKKKLLK